DDRQHGPRDGDGRAIERGNEARALLPRHLVAAVETASLVVCAIRRAGDLAILATLAATRHPGSQADLATRGASQVAAAGGDDLIRQAQTLKDLLFNVQQFLMDALALVRRGEGEHLHLGELVNAIQPARVAARCAGFGAETVRQADVLLR